MCLRTGKESLLEGGRGSSNWREAGGLQIDVRCVPKSSQGVAAEAEHSRIIVHGQEPVGHRCIWTERCHLHCESLPCQVQTTFSVPLLTDTWKACCHSGHRHWQLQAAQRHTVVESKAASQ